MSLNSRKDEDILKDLHSAQGRLNSSEIIDLETEVKTNEMKEKIHRANKEQDIQIEQLKNMIQPDGIIEIQRKDIPEGALKLFEGYSRRFILPEEYKEGNFQQYGVIEHNGDKPYKTYFAVQEKDLKGYKEQNIYLYEIDEKEKKIGHGEIRLGLSNKEFFKDKPFVGFTNTEDEYENKGYGKKRIETMNILAQKIRGLKLHSDELFSDPKAKKIRERLEQEGKAKRYKEKGGQERFYMI